MPVRAVDRGEQRRACASLHDTARPGGGVERVRTRTHEQRKECRELGATVAYGRGGKEQYATVRDEPRQLPIARGCAIAHVMRFVHDHQPVARHAAGSDSRAAAAQGFHGNETQLHSRRCRRTSPHRAQCGRCHDDSLRNVACERERHERLSESRLVGEERASRAVDALTDAEHRLALVRVQRDRANGNDLIACVAEDGARYGIQYERRRGPHGTSVPGTAVNARTT